MGDLRGRGGEEEGVDGSGVWDMAMDRDVNLDVKEILKDFHLMLLFTPPVAPAL